MNSFRFLERGIEAELARQRELLEAGGEVVQETLHFDPRERHADAAALEGGGARLPLLPRARPGAAGADRGDAARGARVAARAAGGADASATRPSSASPTRPRRLLAFDAELGRVLRARRRGRGRRSSRRSIANWVTGELAAALRQAGGEDDAAASKVDARGPRRAGRPGQEKKISHGSGKTGAGDAGRRGRRPGRDRRARGPRPDLRLRRARGDRRRGDRAPTPTPPSRSAPATARRSAPIVGAVMKETKGRADGGEVNRLIKEQLERSEP